MAPNIGLRQSMQLRQQLVMTQRLQQALKLLQVPTLELEQILRKELVENPLLEEVDHDEEVEEATQQETEIAALEEGERVKEQDPQDENRDWGDSFDDGFRGVNNERGYDEEDEMERPQKYVPSGQEALSEQLQLAIPEGPERNIGEYIIGCLGADGLLACPLEEIAAFFEVDVEVVEAVLTVVQTFDPPGVAARDISECLLLQLEAKGQGESPEAHIIRQHFESLKNRKFSDIAREMKITPREVQDIAQRIGELDPRPGLSTSGDGARAIVPDLEVIKVDEDGDGFAVALMDGNLPPLAGQPGLRESGAAEHRGRRQVHRREEEARRVGHQDHRAAAAHHDQGHGGHRGRADRVFREGRHRPQTPDPQPGGVHHRDARVHGFPRHAAEVCPDAAWSVPAEVLLQCGPRFQRGRRGGRPRPSRS